ncbi:TPA: RES family NAD+ phosphorylase [Yersinia enterocolitica]|nr:RES family NAD+ phosphorylase [Yersinia enterocolitica]HDL6983964.1 RES family NAD+ phosphorylase [Yersinia enterocolitica]HDL7063877.1 RES family NAD+ phosphorylase [Yersinia enterocolitica]HDL7067958.1 RES family NAD+ phosphorylase [Yersinia enterocolitica]HDL7068258.1 RES family NAD+ phosphorylase [Yersinia enterocolitica]
MGKTITETYPPLPLDKLLLAINNFSTSSTTEKRKLIKQLVRQHVTLSVEWQPGWRFKRARLLKSKEDIPKNVNEIIWRKDIPATIGRANPAGFPVLYLADREDTALSEVRVNNGRVVIADFEILPDRKIQVVPIGELSLVQKKGRGDILGDGSKHINDMINACNPEEAKALLITDNFLLECLTSADENYEISSYVAKCIFDKLPKISAIAYPSQRQRGAINFAVRIEKEQFWDNWGVRAVKCLDARHLAYGYYNVSNINHVTGMTYSGEFVWDDKLDQERSTMLLDPLWVPTKSLES